MSRQQSWWAKRNEELPINCLFNFAWKFIVQNKNGYDLKVRRMMQMRCELFLWNFANLFVYRLISAESFTRYISHHFGSIEHNLFNKFVVIVNVVNNCKKSNQIVDCCLFVFGSVNSNVHVKKIRNFEVISDEVKSQSVTSTLTIQKANIKQSFPLQLVETVMKLLYSIRQWSYSKAEFLQAAIYSPCQCANGSINLCQTQFYPNSKQPHIWIR